MERKDRVSSNKTKKWMTLVVILAAVLQIVTLGIHVWLHLGLSRAVNEKTLNISYDELINNYEFQRITHDQKLNRERTDGPLLDKETVYGSEVIDHGNYTLLVDITVDESTQEVEKIYLNFNADTLDGVILSEMYMEANITIRAFLNKMDEDMPKEIVDDICSMLNPVENKKLKESDSYTYEEIGYGIQTVAVNDGYDGVVYTVCLTAQSSLTEWDNGPATLSIQVNPASQKSDVEEDDTEESNTTSFLPDKLKGVKNVYSERGMFFFEGYLRSLDVNPAGQPRANYSTNSVVPESIFSIAAGPWKDHVAITLKGYFDPTSSDYQSLVTGVALTRNMLHCTFVVNSDAEIISITPIGN